MPARLHNHFSLTVSPLHTTSPVMLGLSYCMFDIGGEGLFCIGGNVYSQYNKGICIWCCVFWDLSIQDPTIKVTLVPTKSDTNKDMPLLGTSNHTKAIQVPACRQLKLEPDHFSLRMTSRQADAL